MANVNVDMLKEKLYPTASAIFCIGEVCVDVSKQHISPEQAIDKIREYLKEASFYSKHSANKLIEECAEDNYVESDLINRSEAISNLIRQPMLTKSVVRRVLAQTEGIKITEDGRIRGKWKLHEDGNGTCNVCNFTSIAVWDFDNWLNFCPHCGADMRWYPGDDATK